MSDTSRNDDNGQDGDQPGEVGAAILRLLEAQEAKRDRPELIGGRGDSALSLRFVEAIAPGRHAIPTAFLGTALRDIQSSLSYAVWSQEAGPNVQGDVPGSVARSAATEVVALDAGSFVVTLRKAELELSDSFDRAVDLILDLIDAADDNQFGDEVEQYVHRMGTATAVRLERFFKRVGNAGTSLDVSWEGLNARRVFLSDLQARALAEWLSNAVPTREIVQVFGQLKMADVDTGRFKLVDPSTQAVYEGKSQVDLSHRELDASYRATVEIVTYSAHVSGDTKQRMVLLQLAPS